MKRIIVIGGGPGGNVAALVAARHGAEKVVLVEKGAMGGTCTNNGCIPTKFFLSRLAQAASKGGLKGEEWSRIMSHKNALIRGLSSSIEKSCLAAGVEIIKGHGSLAGTNTVEVRGAGGEKKVVEGDSIIIATGSAPAAIPGISLDTPHVLTSTKALDLSVPPRSLIIIGSGAVGSEFAFMYHLAGAKVTIVEAMDRLFPTEDSEVHDLFVSLFGKMGIDVITGDPVASIESPDGGSPRVTLSSGNVLESDKVLVGAGRRLLTEDIGLDRAGLEPGPRGELAVDSELRTLQPHIFGIGDVTGRLLLAHLASFQGVQAARRAIGRPSREVPYHAIPWSIFTTPEIATVGMNETSAVIAGLDCVTAVVPWMDNIKARMDRTTDGFVKVVADRAGGRIVGGTIVGSHASDMIHVLSSAVHGNMTVDDMAGMVFAHPGLAESIYEAVQKILHLQSSQPGRA